MAPLSQEVKRTGERRPGASPLGSWLLGPGLQAGACSNGKEWSWAEFFMYFFGLLHSSCVGRHWQSCFYPGIAASDVKSEGWTSLTLKRSQAVV